MITGYNTDVRHQDVVFHVQTEDKGQGNPCIESLVYVGGQVLAARRADYQDLLEAGGGDQAVLARMEKQHRAMIAAIRRGKLDRKMADLVGHDLPLADGDASTAGGPTLGAEADPASATTGGLPQVGAEPPSRPTGFDSEGDRTLDQVILDYLSSEAEQAHLELQVAGEPRIRLGAPAKVELRAASSIGNVPVPGAEVTVRMISTIAEPRTLTSGVTDSEGRLALQFDVPDLGRGTTALIINADSELGRAEIKQLL